MPNTEPTQTQAPQPQAGGSYTRHPETGELTLVERTAPASGQPATEQPPAQE